MLGFSHYLLGAVYLVLVVKVILISLGVSVLFVQLPFPFHRFADFGFHPVTNLYRVKKLLIMHTNFSGNGVGEKPESTSAGTLYFELMKTKSAVLRTCSENGTFKKKKHVK